MARRPGKVVFLQGARFAADGQVHASAARMLPMFGYTVKVACPGGSGEQATASSLAFAKVPGVEVVPTGLGPVFERGRPLSMLRALVCGGVSAAVSAARLIRLVRRDDTDVVHCTEKARETILGYAVSRLGRTALVIHLHVGVDTWFSRPTRWVMQRADRLIAISEFVRQTAIDAGYPAERVSVALNGWAPHDVTEPDPPDAAEVASRAAGVRDELGVPEGAVLVAIIARLNPWKGHRPLFEAVKRLTAEGRDIVVVVAGDDGTPDLSGECGRALTGLAATLGIGDRTRFVGFRTDADRFMAACDVFAMPSSEEPFGLVFLEAMAMGKPVLAVGDGGTPEVVVDGATGLLAAPGDVDDLTAQLRRLIDDPPLRARLGIAGRARLHAHFTAERMTADIAAIYDSVRRQLNEDHEPVSSLRGPTEPSP